MKRIGLMLPTIVLVLAAIAVLIHSRQVSPEVQKWQARAEATADDPKAVRQVILDAIFADKTFVVAQAYQTSYQEKPWRAARIANFAHATIVANIFCSRELNKTPDLYPQFFAMDTEARKALKSIILPSDPMDMASAANANVEIEMEDRKNFKPTKIADAWLAWGYFTGKDGYEPFQQALRLDPNFGEAYYFMVNTGQCNPPGSTHAQKEAAYALCLTRAEQLEPKLRPLVDLYRYGSAQKQGDKKAAIAYLSEYLRLWPTAYHADALRQTLAQLEASQQQKHDTSKLGL